MLALFLNNLDFRRVLPGQKPWFKVVCSRVLHIQLHAFLSLVLVLDVYSNSEKGTLLALHLMLCELYYFLVLRPNDSSDLVPVVMITEVKGDPSTSKKVTSKQPERPKMIFITNVPKEAQDDLSFAASQRNFRNGSTTGELKGATKQRFRVLGKDDTADGPTFTYKEVMAAFALKQTVADEAKRQLLLEVV